MSTTEEDGRFHVDFADGGARVNLDDIRSRQEALMPGGKHAWVVHSIYGVEDPDQAMDTFELGAENFVAVSPIYCLLCEVTYRPELRHEKCSQKPARMQMQQ